MRREGAKTTCLIGYIWPRRASLDLLAPGASFEKRSTELIGVSSGRAEAGLLSLCA